MPPRRQFVGKALALGALSGAGLLPVLAQGRYPTKPITLIVPFAPGGIADIVARTVSQAMGESLGQTVVVDNRPSAGSIVAGQAVAKAAPDGYTLMVMSNANAVSTGQFRKLPFDVTKDFAPISTMGFFELVLCVPRESRFKTLRDMVAHAKANPGLRPIAWARRSLASGPLEPAQTGPARGLESPRVRP